MLNENDSNVIYNLNELKKVMINLIAKFEDDSLKNNFRASLVEFHRRLSEYIEPLDKDGYIYRMKKSA